MICNRLWHDKVYELHKNTWQTPFKFLHPRNPPNPETQLPRYKFSAPKLPRAIRVGPNEGGTKIWIPNSGREEIGPRTPGSINSRNLGPHFFFSRIDKPPDFSPHAWDLPWARGSCGAKAPPPPCAQPKSQFEFVTQDTEESELFEFEFVLWDLSFSIWWISGA